FTGIAVAQLINQGSVKASDPLSKFVKEYPLDISQQVTVRHLLLHTSGIELDDSPGYRQELTGANSLGELLKLQLKYIDSLNENRRPHFKPLNKFDYSNEEYDLLGVIIERVTGMSYRKYIQKNILDPLRMRQTNFLADTTMFGYSHYKDLYKPTRWFTYRFQPDRSGSPSGGLYSTTSDLLKLFDGLQGKKLFHNGWLKTLASDTVTSSKTSFYGYGVEGLSVNYLSYGHNGGNVKGVSSEFRFFPELDLFIVILCNRVRSAPDVMFHLQKVMLRGD
ncbi:MAG: beta-lactamase family protein, partial [Flammeovirgaceae bacterium]|nr:beta-lactamase family protein [Flammeovirgaceae bacterium]